MLFPVNMVASADSVQEPSVQPRWTYTNYTSSALSVTASGMAYCTSDIQAYNNVTKIHIKMTLQKYTVLWWSKEESWEATFYGVTGEMCETVQLGNGRYRVKSEFTVYSGSDTEEITTMSQEKKVTIS